MQLPAAARQCMTLFCGVACMRRLWPPEFTVCCWVACSFLLMLSMFGACLFRWMFRDRTLHAVESTKEFAWWCQNSLDWWLFLKFSQLPKSWWLLLIHLYPFISIIACLLCLNFRNSYWLIPLHLLVDHRICFKRPRIWGALVYVVNWWPCRVPISS